METVSTPGNTPATAETYTKEQVENIVKERLVRDREARKSDAETEAAKLREQADKAQAELTSAAEKLKALEGTSATAEEISKKVDASYAEIEKAIPEDKRKLIPTKYSSAEKIEYIAQNKGLFFPEQVSIPKTPEPASTTDGGGNPAFGGYASAQQWAQSDPKGYLAAQQKGRK